MIPVGTKDGKEAVSGVRSDSDNDDNNDDELLRMINVHVDDRNPFDCSTE